MDQTTIKELSYFLEQSPTSFHTVQNITDILLKERYTELQENQRWRIKKGGRYFVARNGSSIIAFTVPENGITSMHIMASHSDSPAFKIKENWNPADSISVSMSNGTAVCSAPHGWTARSQSRGGSS